MDQLAFLVGFAAGSLWSVVLLLLNKRNGKKTDISKIENIETLIKEMVDLLDKKRK